MCLCDGTLTFERYYERLFGIDLDGKPVKEKKRRA
jgi:hypothetical protein